MQKMRCSTDQAWSWRKALALGLCWPLSAPDSHPMWQKGMCVSVEQTVSLLSLQVATSQLKQGNCHILPGLTAVLIYLQSVAEDIANLLINAMPMSMQPWLKHPAFRAMPYASIACSHSPSSLETSGSPFSTNQFRQCCSCCTLESQSTRIWKTTKKQSISRPACHPEVV